MTNSSPTRRSSDLVVDFSKNEAIAAAAAEVRAKVGTLDVLINNAGIIRGKYFWEHDAQRDIEMTMAINALAPMYIAREFLPDMLADRSGERRIVNISSAASLVSNPDRKSTRLNSSH